MSDGVHFHGNISAGTFNNAVHGDINNNVNYGNQQMNVGLDAAKVAELVRTLRAELDAAPLSASTKDALHDKLDEVDREVVTGGGQRSVRDKLRAIKDVITDANGVIAGGGTLWTTFKALALAAGLVI